MTLGIWIWAGFIAYLIAVAIQPETALNAWKKAIKKRDIVKPGCAALVAIWLGPVTLIIVLGLLLAATFKKS